MSPAATIILSTIVSALIGALVAILIPTPEKLTVRIGVFVVVLVLVLTAILAWLTPFPEPEVEVTATPNGELATLVSQLQTMVARTPEPQTPAAEVAATITALQLSIEAFVPTMVAHTPEPQTPAAEVAATITAFQLTIEAFVPTGRIVYTCYNGQVDNICRIDADGRNQAQLTLDTLTSFYAALSPNGQQVVWSSRRDGSFQLYLMDINGGSQRLVSPSNSPGSYLAPNISPDGSRIIFTLAINKAQNIWIMNSDGSNASALTDTTGSNVDPVWSPDGAKIAFVSDRNNTADLFVMDSDGSDLRAFNVGINNMGGRIDWSPYGNWLAFYAGESSKRQIYLVSLVSGEVRQITNLYDNLAPSFSPDGQWITFASWRDGDGEIYVMRSDGSDVRQLTFNEQSDWQPSWGP